MKPTDKVSVLFLMSGPFALDRRLKEDRITYLSKCYSGDIIAPVNKPTIQATRLNTVHLETFRLHPFPYHYGSGIIRTLISCYNQITKAIKIFYKDNIKYKVIISSNPLATGIIALLIAKITGSRVVIEVNGNFESAFKYGRLGKAALSIEDKVKDKVARFIVRLTLKRADMVKLLSENQLKPLYDNNDYQKLRFCTFPNFVPIEYFLHEETKDGKYILLLGFPWYLKGVDILIKAFNKISRHFPAYTLKIVGWCPEGREYYENLAKYNSKIELHNPVPHKDVIPLMAGCSLYVLASRTEAMGRVLLEAMASRKPIIASDVGGVSSIIKHGFNGLLFENENVDDLAQKIKLLLSDKDLAEKLVQNGFQYVQENLSEECYIENYRNMIEKVMSSK